MDGKTFMLLFIMQSLLTAKTKGIRKTDESFMKLKTALLLVQMKLILPLGKMLHSTKGKHSLGKNKFYFANENAFILQNWDCSNKYFFVNFSEMDMNLPTITDDATSLEGIVSINSPQNSDESCD